MAHRENPDDPIVRINVFLPVSERDAFDKWCRYGARPKVSMTARIRQLIHADTTGKLHLPREKVKKQPQKPKKPNRAG